MCMHVFLKILNEKKSNQEYYISTIQILQKNFFHHHGPLHLQVPFSEQEPFYLSEFQPQSSRPLDAAQSNSLENGKHDIKMYIDKLHVQL